MPSRQNDYEQATDAMLKADHQRVKDLFAHSEAAANEATKWTLAARVFVELDTYAQLEANVCSPAVHEETNFV